MRAFRIAEAFVGRSVAELERSFAPAKVFVERIRRGTELLDAAPESVLRSGDHVAVGARRHVLLAPQARPSGRRWRTGRSSTSP